jgi:acyl carrier protein
MSSELEGTIASIWGEVLEREAAIEPQDNFFALGGDSLGATIVLFQVHEQLGVELAPASLLDAPTFSGFCGLVGAARRANA